MYRGNRAFINPATFAGPSDPRRRGLNESGRPAVKRGGSDDGYGSGIRRSGARDRAAPQHNVRIDRGGDRDQRENKNDDYSSHDPRFIAPDCGQIGEGSRQKSGAAPQEGRWCEFGLRAVSAGGARPPQGPPALLARYGVKAP